MDRPASSMAFRALFDSSDKPTTVFHDRLAHWTGEQRSTDCPELLSFSFFPGTALQSMAGHLFNPFNRLH